MMRAIVKSYDFLAKCLSWLAPVGDLVIRLWIAKVFFMSGLVKVQSWETTLMLFQYEYSVPLIPPYWAAVSGTAVEILMPIFLLIGLGGRLPALILFVFNIIAVVSYPYLLTKVGYVGLQDHIYWGMLLMVLMLHGSGKLALDSLIKK